MRYRIKTRAELDEAARRSQPAPVKKFPDVVRAAAIEDLKRRSEPIKCERCGGGPGEPSCGKTIHAIMDDAFDRAAADLLTYSKEEK